MKNYWYRWKKQLDALVDEDGNTWVNPDREYIVFLCFMGIDASAHKRYYSLVPSYRYNHLADFSHCNMYPIENGNVIDEGNILGFGEVVPVEVFKQHIRNKINEIKNYGE